VTRAPCPVPANSKSQTPNLKPLTGDPYFDPLQVTLTAEQRRNLVRMRTIATRLESSLLRLDELVLIFNVM